MTTTRRVQAPKPAAPARTKVHFPSGGTTCAAWHYQGSNGGCVVMAGGFAVTKEAATDLFARRFSEAGFQRARLRLPPPRRERRPSAAGGAHR